MLLCAQERTDDHQISQTLVVETQSLLIVSRISGGTPMKVKGKIETIPPQKPGQRPIKFHPGGLHQSLGVPAGKKIPTKAMGAALSGKEGPLAKRQANFAKNVLVGRKGK